ncbi:hypothetical protein AA313_de0203764 [Arthrobotrys entomopaga]|nr:hypothetical protein AA313_de0203764 [Arthrobotrys entomopaga]
MERTVAPPKEGNSEPVTNESLPSDKPVLKRVLPPTETEADEALLSGKSIAAQTVQSDKPTAVPEMLSYTRPAPERTLPTQPAPAFNYIPVQSPYVEDSTPKFETTPAKKEPIPMSTTVASASSPITPEWPSQLLSSQKSDPRQIINPNGQPQARAEVNDVEMGDVEKEKAGDKKGVRVLKSMLITLGEVWTSFRDWWFG